MELDFRNLREDSATALNTLLGQITAHASRADLVRDVKAVCQHLHTLGVASLLVDGYPKDFFLNLGRAGESWRRLLAHLRARGEAPPPVTHLEPLLGAVAAGHWDMARRIVQDSATQRQVEADEYEDDVDWAILLQQLIAPREDAPGRTNELLVRLARSGANTYAERLEVAQALLQRDARAFFDAFEATRLAHEGQTEKLANSFTTPVDRFAPYRYVWFEGLALLRLGERVGLSSGDRFLYCPPLARVRMHVLVDEDWLIPLPT
ncbi:hypothetical protein [Archangium sp.]|uniref:hypothetical protein n=1 Tax=Archangium sp. TaxID=1872627 RepID=UPI002D48E41B|nr:hypothetical protein [Archangium sp.]HYO54400.1 hypothetical protein [Archangium sp.]